MSGPQNFLSRVNIELNKYDLPEYNIINPNNQAPTLLNNKSINIGRLDGVMYYKITSENLYNLLRQRKDKKIKILKYIPNIFTELLTKPLNKHLNRINKTIMEESNSIIFQSQLSKDMHEKFIGTINKRNKIILNGIPTDIFNPNISKVSLEGFPKLVITASFRLHKRLQDAILIVNAMKSKYPNIKLHVIGDIDKLTKECIDTLNLSNCIFHGKIKSENLPAIYNSCDVGLSPSIFDPCPNSVVEMMGCSLPVISVKESGASELIHCEDLVIKEELDINFYELQTVERLPKLNIDKWIKEIEKILENRQYYSETVLKRIEEELDIRIVAKKYANFIKETYESNN